MSSEAQLVDPPPHRAASASGFHAAFVGEFAENLLRRREADVRQQRFEIDDSELRRRPVDDEDSGG